MLITDSEIQGCYESDARYSSAFDNIQSENLLGKLVLLRSLLDDCTDQTFAIPALNVEKLLVQQPLHPSRQQLTPLSMAASMEPVAGPSHGGLVSPQSPVCIGMRYPDPRYVSSTVTSSVELTLILLLMPAFAQAQV